MSRHLFLAGFGARDATDRLLRQALALVPDPSRILYLCPSPRKLRDTQVRFCRILGRDAFVPPAFATIRQLARELHGRYGRTRRLPAELRPLLVRRVLQSKIQNPKWKQGQPPISPDGNRTAVPFGYARAVSDFVGDVKRHVRQTDRPGLRDRFRTMLRGFDEPLGRALDALDAMDAYQELLSAAGWADDEDILDQGAELCRRHVRSSVLVLDGFAAPDPLEQAMLSALIEQAGHVLALTWGSADDRPEYRHPKRFASFIESLPGFQRQFLPEPGEMTKSECRVTEGNVPSDGTSPDSTFDIRHSTLAEGQAAEPVSLFAFNSVEDEVSGICHDLNRQPESAADTIVALPRLERYAGLLERVFERYRVRCTVYPSRRLATSPPVIAVLELLEALENDYGRLATAAFLGSRFFPGLLRLPDDPDDSGRNRALLTLNRDSCRAGIIKDRDNWRHIGRRLLSLDEDMDEAERARIADLERRVRWAIGLAESIMYREPAEPRARAGPQPRRTLGEHARALRDFLERVGFRRALAATEMTKSECRVNEGNVPSDGTSPNSTFDTRHSELAEDRRALYDTLDRLVELDEVFGPFDCTGRQFIRTLRYLIGLVSRQPESSPRGVTVINMTETLGLEPERLYFCGLTEPDLPAAHALDPILPDRVRRELGMLDIERHQDSQRFEFARTVRSSRTRPFLSYHAAEDDKLILPTPFLELEPVPAPRPSALRSEEEVQVRAGERSGILLAEVRQAVDFTGVGPVLESLAGRFGPEQSIGVTRLENYRRCPFRFYLEHVLGLETPPEPAYEIDAARWGLLLHQVLEGLYQEGPVLPDAIPARARSSLALVLERSGLPAFWQEVTRRVFENILPEFVLQEEKMRREGFTPTRTESFIAGEPLPGIKVHGRLDRVDSGPDAFRVIDYKSGSAAGFSGKAVVRDRTHLQLPLYARLQTGRSPGKRIDNMGVWALRDARVIWLATKEYPAEALIAAALDNARDVVAAIRTGRFPVDEVDPNACRNCELGFLCGREQVSENTDA